MRMHHLALPLCLASLISSTAGALAAPAEVLAAVNLRTGPGAQYYALTILPPGTPVEIYGCLADNSWCDVGYGDTRGWLAARYIGAARAWSPEQQIMRPPVFEPPPIYREPPVYATPPVYSEPAPVYRGPDWESPEDFSGDVYLEPPPAYVYRPPVEIGPPMPALPVPDGGVYQARPKLDTAPPLATQPPLVASTPPATARPDTAPSVLTNRPTTATPPPATATPPATTTSPTVATSAPPTAPAAEVKPKYGSAVGKPGAPCKWVNGVCRND